MATPRVRLKLTRLKPAYAGIPNGFVLGVAVLRVSVAASGRLGKPSRPQRPVVTASLAPKHELLVQGAGRPEYAVFVFSAYSLLSAVWYPSP